MISHEKYIQGVYKKVQNGTIAKSYRLKNGLFDIRVPYKQKKNAKHFNVGDIEKSDLNESVINRSDLHQSDIHRSDIHQSDLNQRNHNQSDHNQKKSDIKENADQDHKELLEDIETVKQALITLTAKFTPVDLTNPWDSPDVDNEDNSKAGKSDAAGNSNALRISNEIYTKTKDEAIGDAQGYNDVTSLRRINSSSFLFPENCRFYNKDITEIKDLVKEEFDFIVLDPPWWNKYIRRKRKSGTAAYPMMYNEQLKAIPMMQLLKEDGLVAVWCTNSPTHLRELQEEIFPSWGLQPLGKWFWLKVTRDYRTVCDFSKPPGKQPFEQIVFGRRSSEFGSTSGRSGSCPGSFGVSSGRCGSSSGISDMPSSVSDMPSPHLRSGIFGFVNRKVLVSVPSALHSHKPPLCELVKELVGGKPDCLEIFARYLLPNWSSYGLEATLFQHECVYEEVQE